MTPSPTPQQQRHIDQGAKGVAGRVLGGTTTSAAVARAHLRSAVRRVSGQKNAAAPTAETPEESPAPEIKAEIKAELKAERATQAALGMIGTPPERFDEDSLRAWLGKMPPESLQKLSRLVWAAKQGKNSPDPGFNKLERQLAQQGVHLDIDAQTVTVNLTQQAAPTVKAGSSYTPSRRPRTTSWPRADWGRQLGRIKDFINGH